jgi:hypothetical protein
LGRGRGHVSGSRPYTESEVSSASSDEDDDDASSDSVEFDGAEIEAEAAAEEETEIGDDGWEVDHVPIENIRNANSQVACFEEVESIPF